MYKFAVGYDDAIDVDPSGNEIVTRYGKHWNMGCRVKIADNVVSATVDPDGEHVNYIAENTTILNYDFDLKVCLEPDCNQVRK